MDKELLRSLTDAGAVMRVDEAHALFGSSKISRGAFYAAINRDQVPHIKMGHRILIPRYAFLKWLEDGTRNT
jgi:hypothetical protein